MGFLRQGCLLGVVALLLPVVQAHGAQDVLVSAVHFPPYVVRPEKQEPSGLLLSLVDALNHQQADYRFVLRPTSLGRRFDDFTNGRYDIALFENPRWSWGDIPGDRVDMRLEDAEVFVTQARKGRDESYFSSLVGKRLALFSGYHYGFAGFNNDPDWLATHFDVRFTYAQESNLKMVLRERVDIAPVTRSWLNQQIQLNPQLEQQLLISQREDQHYRHYALLRPGAPISPERFGALIDELRSGGVLQAIFEPVGIHVVMTD